MLKLYYDGWETTGKPITVGKIKSFSFVAGEDPDSVVNSWNSGVTYTRPWAISSLYCDVTEGDGFKEFVKTIGDGKELFTDSTLTDSTGITVKKYSPGGYEFVSGDTTLFAFSEAGELCSIYDGVTYVDYLKSIAQYEKDLVNGNAKSSTVVDPAGNPIIGAQPRAIPSMSISPLAAPFVLHVKSRNEFTYYANTANQCLSFATLYKIYFKKNLVQVDKMTAGVFVNLEPAVAYNPANIVVKAIGKADADTAYAYDDDVQQYDYRPFIISNAPQDNAVVPGTVEDITCYKEEETSTSYKSIGIGKVAATCLQFVQLGSEVTTSMLPSYRTLIKDVFDTEGYLHSSDGKDWTSNPRWIMTYNGLYYPDKTYLVETVPVWNVSKMLKQQPKDNFGLFGTTQKIPLFAIMGNPLAFNATGKYNVFNLAAPIMFPSAANEVSKITGSEYSQWFYNSEVVDAGDKPVPPAAIPDDDGNGGFNNSDYLGGNGSWQDTTTDMSYDKNNPLWHTPNNLGLDGNYDIVKLNRASVELLASQTWTQGGWLAYLAKMSNISRAGDGIADIKTCFAEIPTTGAAQIAAIAGYGLNKPIPCNRVNQYNQFDMGTVDVPVYFGSFLDYAPYTEIVLELPFAQPVKIPPEVVVGYNIHLTLSVDLMSNSAMYIIICNGRLLAQVPANIFINIPFAASEYSESAVSALTGYIANASNIGSNVAGGVQSKLDKGKPPINAASAAFELAGAPAAAVHEAASRQESRNITQISQGGGGGAIGAMGLKYATLKITRPYVTIPPRYYELQGCPSGFVKRVGDCTGYLEVEQIYGSIPCNTDEFNAIVSQLKGGIFP